MMMMRMQSPEEKLAAANYMLTSFGERLKCDEEYYRDGKRLGQKVFEKLQSSSKFSVAKVKFVGSFGKKTDVIHPDLDLAVVINDNLPPFKDVLNDFEDILTLNESTLEIMPGTIRTTRFSVQFTFTNGIPVDLLPAANFDHRNRVLAKMRANEDQAHYYSSSLADEVLAFMASQNGFTHTLIRVAKFWAKTLHVGGKLSGGSTMFELIACAAAEEEEKFEERSILRAFNRFIDYVKGLDSLKLVFQKRSDGKWNKVPVGELAYDKCTLDSSVVAKREILKQKSFIIEPANPYNDMLSWNKVEVLQKLQQFASITRKRLSELMDGGHGIVSARTEEDMVGLLGKLFEPLPTNLKAEFPSAYPTDFLCSYAAPWTSIYCDMTVRNESSMANPAVRIFIEVMKRNLLTAVHYTVRSCSNITTLDVQGAVDNYFERNLQQKLVPCSGKEHGDYDVTLCIPYKIGETIYAVRASMNWK